MPRATRPRALAVVPAAVAWACSTPPLGVAERAQLERAERRWQQGAPSSYRYEFKLSCFCSPDATRPVEIVVVDEGVVSVTPLDGAPPVPASELDDWPTVDGLFGIIRNALDSDRSDIEDVRVRYDAELGYPTSIELDPPDDLLDAGATYSAAVLTPLT